MTITFFLSRFSFVLLSVHLGNKKRKIRQIASLEKTADGITIHTDSGETLSGFDQVIWAIGREPLSADLNLAAAGVEADKRGYIPTDKTEKEGFVKAHGYNWIAPLPEKLILDALRKVL